MSTLYKINQQLENFEFEVDLETGELTNALQWDFLNLAYEEKCENIACFIKNLKSDVEDFKAEEKALADRRKSKERKIEYLSDLLLENMNFKKFETAKCAISFRRSEQVSIPDESIVPNEYMKVTITCKPDKTAIKAAIKAGESVNGCEIIEKQNLNIK